MRSIGMERTLSRKRLWAGQLSQSQSQLQLQPQMPVVDARLNVPPADCDRECRTSVGGKGGGGRASITHSPATSPFLPSTPWQSPVLPGEGSSPLGYSYAVMGVVSPPTSPGGGGGGGGAVPSGALSLLLTCGEFSLRARALLIRDAVHARCTRVCAPWQSGCRRRVRASGSVLDYRGSSWTSAARRLRVIHSSSFTSSPFLGILFLVPP
jgi:hypothetical protein